MKGNLVLPTIGSSKTDAIKLLQTAKNKKSLNYENHNETSRDKTSLPNMREGTDEDGIFLLKESPEKSALSNNFYKNQSSGVLIDDSRNDKQVYIKTTKDRVNKKLQNSDLET